LTSHAAGRLLLLYKQWAIASNNRILSRMVQRPDAGVATGMLSMVGVGALINLQREPEYLDKSWKQIGMDALATSGALGMMWELNEVVEQASGDQIGVRAALGIEPFAGRDPHWGERAKAAGPVPGQWGYFAWAFSSGDADAQEKARALWNFIPYQNLWFIRTFSRKFRRAFGEHIVEELE
jgi:hypothetical protein